MRESTRVHTKGSDSLFMMACILCTLYIVMRGLTAGVSISTPQVYSLGAISLGAMLCAILSRLLCNGLILPARRIMSVLFLGVLVVIATIMNAVALNYGYAAMSVGYTWLSDILIFVAVLLTARERNVFRLYASTIGSSVVIVGIYALYQKIYALGYLHEIATDSLVFKESIRSKGNAVAQAFINRLEDGWVGGGFGSDSALCAFALLFIFFIFGVRNKKQDSVAFDIALFMGLMAVVLSGSMYGILIGKIFEMIVLYKVIGHKHSKLKDILLVVGGVGIASILSCILVIGFWLATGGEIAGIVFTILWYTEIELLRRRYSSDTHKNVEYLVGIGFLIILSLLASILLLSSASSELGFYRRLLESRVLANTYAISAAWSAFLDSPIIGWGLDNFSEVHALYKSPMSRSVGRAGNLYYEMLADGGVVLLGAFLIIVITIIFSGGIERREHREVEFEAKRFKAVGPALVVVGFCLTYVFVVLGLFEHMGVEYFIAEATSSPESFMARGVSIMPLVTHFVVNIVCLPLIGIYAFKQFWVMSRGTDYSNITFYIKLSLIAFLLYAASGAYLFHSALSGFFWVMIGLLLARQRAWGMLSFRPKTRMIVAYLILLVGISWGTWGVWSGLVSATAERGAMLSAGRYNNIQKLQKALTAFDNALELEEDNAELHLQRSNLLIQMYDLRAIPASQSEVEDIISHIRRAIGLRPKSSEYRVALARVLSMYDLAEKQEEIEQNFELALTMYPINARYPYLYAKYLYDLGDFEGAQEQAKNAIELNSLYEVDFNTRLRRHELYKARGMANGKRKNSN